jgi:hypothetical protein
MLIFMTAELQIRQDGGGGEIVVVAIAEWSIAQI